MNIIKLIKKKLGVVDDSGWGRHLDIAKPEEKVTSTISDKAEPVDTKHKKYVELLKTYGFRSISSSELQKIDPVANDGNLYYVTDHRLICYVHDGKFTICNPVDYINGQVEIINDDMEKAKSNLEKAKIGFDNILY